MNQDISALLEKVKTLEDEIEAKLAQRRAAFHTRLQNGKLAFASGIEQRHRELKVRLSHYILGARPLVLLTAPLIYAMIVPLLLLDMSATLYQVVCFPVYGIRKVRRADYLIFDRAELGYLNIFEKINCAYCSYGNGLIAFIREIAGRTEQYWCPIKHGQRTLAAHGHYNNFVEFGDAESYHSELEALRTQLGKDK